MPRKPVDSKTRASLRVDALADQGLELVGHVGLELQPDHPARAAAA